MAKDGDEASTKISAEKPESARRGAWTPKRTEKADSRKSINKLLQQAFDIENETKVQNLVRSAINPQE